MPISAQYSYSERNDQIKIKIPLKGASPASVDIFVTSTLLKVNFSPYLVEILLYKEVDAYKHKAIVKEGVLHLQLFKSSPGKWGQLEMSSTSATATTTTNENDTTNDNTTTTNNKKELHAKKLEAVDQFITAESKNDEIRKDRSHADEKFALRKQMAIDTGERDRLDRIKAEEKKDEEERMYEVLGKLRDQELAKQKASSSPTTATTSSSSPATTTTSGSENIFDLKSLENVSDVSNTSSSAGSKVVISNNIDDIDSDSDNDNNADDKDDDDDDDDDKAIFNDNDIEDDEEEVSYIPPPRSTGVTTTDNNRIGIKFTPRHFPTPMRESKLTEEEDWVAKNRKHLKKHGILAKLQQDTGGEVEDEDPNWLKGKGDDFFRGGDFLSAINAYSSALDVDEQFVPVISNRANCYLQLKRYENCCNDCTEAIKLLQTEIPELLSVEANAVGNLIVKLQLRRGTSNCQLGEYPQALDDYRNALKGMKYDIMTADSNGGSGTTTSTSTSQWVDIVSQSESDITMLEKLEKMDSLKRKADLKFGEGEIDEAMSFYTSALEVVDVNVSCLSNRSACKMAKGDLKGCIDDTTAALSILERSNTVTNQSVNMLGAILPQAGSDKRKKWVTTTILRRGAAYAQTGNIDDMEKALADYSYASGLNPDNPSLASDLMKLRNTYEAKRTGILE